MQTATPTLEQIRAEKARRHLKPFMGRCWERPTDDPTQSASDLVEGAHIDLICETLEDVETAVRERRYPEGAIVVIELPPRHAKTECVGRSFIPWAVCRNPDWDFIFATYGQELSNDVSRVARERIREHGHLWDVELSAESASVKRWEIAHRRGGVTAVGMGGPITGRGAHIFVVDDPLKGAEEAMSEVIRDGQWDWFESVAQTRLVPGGIVVLMGTRWHEGDLIGRALERAAETGQKVIHVRLPLMAEADDPLGRERGAVLWPQRGYDQAWGEALRKRISPWAFAALYQQRPVPDEGGLFTREAFHYYDERDGAVVLDTSAVYPQEKCWRFGTMDLAVSVKERADYTVLIEFEVTPYADLLIRNVHRRRIEGPDQADLAERICREQGLRKIVVEKMGYQLALIQELNRRGLPVMGIAPKGDKHERAIPAAIRMRAGKVFIRRDMPGRNEFEDELLSFPLGEHDDQVDAFAYGVLELGNPSEQKRTFRGGKALEVPHL